MKFYTSKDKQCIDLCDDIDSQIVYLPGLSCLNYPNTICPIIDRLPSFLRCQWEKTVVHHVMRHQDAYPGFHDFASMVQSQARLKNYPNVLSGGVLHTDTERPCGERPRGRSSPKPETDTTRRVLKTTTKPSTTTYNTTASKEKQCPFHERRGHVLSECKAFDAKPLKEKLEWIKGPITHYFLCFGRKV